MKLLVHNFLTSKFLKGVAKGYPLKIVATQVETREADFNAEFIKNMMAKLDWPTLRDAAATIDKDPLPDKPPEALEEDFLKRVHRVLLEIDVMEGHLVCPETGRQFTIRNGIPNMLANEDELV